jgi:hypothetical protein
MVAQDRTRLTGRLFILQKFIHELLPVRQIKLCLICDMAFHGHVSGFGHFVWKVRWWTFSGKDKPGI